MSTGRSKSKTLIRFTLQAQKLIYGAVAFLLYVVARVIYMAKFSGPQYDSVHSLAGFFDRPNSCNIVSSCPNDLPSEQEVVCIFQCMFGPLFEAISANLF